MRSAPRVLVWLPRGIEQRADIVTVHMRLPCCHTADGTVLEIRIAVGDVRRVVRGTHAVSLRSRASGDGVDGVNSSNDNGTWNHLTIIHTVPEQHTGKARN